MLVLIGPGNRIQFRPLTISPISFVLNFISAWLLWISFADDLSRTGDLVFHTPICLAGNDGEAVAM